MKAAELQGRVRDFFQANAGPYDLDEATLRVDYVLNWGGFVNASYRIRDSRRAYHLKLARSAENRAALRRWRSLAPLLIPYHAPPILDWIDLGSAAGLLFPSLEGGPPALDDAVLDQLPPMVGRLGRDPELAAALAPPTPVTARDVYLASFHDRFTEDLRGIREAPPPFLSPSLLGRLDEEVRSLAERIAASPAFREPLTSPVHGDLWLENVLWTSREQWYLLDWDDLRIGDPAADLATLLGPTRDDLRPLKAVDRVIGRLTRPEEERLSLLGRATLLDWVIDPVADWIEAGTAPEHEPLVRREKERIHHRALEHYDRIYR